MYLNILYIIIVVLIGGFSFILIQQKKKIQLLTNLKQQQDVQLAILEEKLTNLNHTYQELLNQKQSLDKKYSSQQDEIIILKEENSKLHTSLQEQYKASEEKLKLLQTSEQRLKTEFKNLATEIFDNNSKKFQEQNQEKLGDILTPIQQQIRDFKKRVEDVYDKESKDRSALYHELQSLKQLNIKLSTEATNLTNALKGNNKTQGNWGEMILENVLENSGLREGYEYQREVSLKDDENKSFRPDVIVKLPDQRDIIIDAKTSLSAYNEYMSCDDEDNKQIYLKNHIHSIKEHIKNLSSKKYENLQGINSLDFIFMFLPIEGALLLALEHDINLYDEAFKQKIILVSPTTLLVALRAVENSWRYEKQAQNIADVYKRAEELYKKFDGFIEDLKKVGKNLENANNSYNEAFKKLSTGRGNLISQVTMLQKVSNIKPKKELDKLLVEEALNTTH